jgi:zinc carboxypeptidase
MRGFSTTRRMTPISPPLGGAMRRPMLVVPLVIALVGLYGSVAASAQAAPCDPISTSPVFMGQVPTAESVLGFDLGSQEVTAAEADAFTQAVDGASARVVSDVLGTSWEGRPLRYALVGKPENVTPAGLAAIREATARLRDPATPPAEAAQLASTTPVTLWLMGNVHGGEESGTDAELRVLYELADRSDCAAQQILDNALIGIIPTQNPDGREAETRQNAYFFDMNRDWFARTQRETDAKLELLRQYPGQMHIDAHEMGGTHFFFPPAADPIYHEVTEENLHWTDDLYGAAMQAEFDRQHIQYFNDKYFDFFAVVYGDMVPSIGFTSGGMTFEKSNFASIAERTYEHYVAHWVSISTGALNREAILADWHAAWIEAYAQGAAGTLQPNVVNDKGNAVQRAVPDIRVRHYFLRSDDPAKEAEVQSLVRRLQRMDVDVFRLTAPIAVPDFTPYAGSAGSRVLPAGTYWIPMQQGQKHWIQSMLNEDTYVPFPYFYDVSGWSNPLLFNVAGGRSGAVLDPQAEPVSLLAEPAPQGLPADPPTVAVFRPSGSTAGRESEGWLRYLLEQVWSMPYASLTASDIAGGGLDGVDVLLVTNGNAGVASNGLGPRGRKALADWVEGGGRYVGWRGGAEVAARLGLTSAQIAAPKSDVAGALIRVETAAGSPLAVGVGAVAWVFYDYDIVMRASNPEHAAFTYPSADSPDFFVSGFAVGEEELGGTAAVIDEPIGQGRVILFASDPNFRAWTVGMQKVLRSAILGPDPGAATFATQAERSHASKTAASLTALDSPIRLTVASGSTAAEAVLRAHGASYTVKTTGGKTRFLIENPGGLSAEEHPYAALLPAELELAGVEVVAFRVP